MTPNVLSRIPFALLIAAMILTSGPVAGAQEASDVGGFSIVARDPVTGDLGIALLSGIPAAGAIVPWASAASGALATQGSANPAFGPEGLRMLGYGWTATQVLDSLLAADIGRDARQVALVDRMGNAAAFTGPVCGRYAAHRTGAGYAVQGNALGGERVLDSMARAFEGTGGDLAIRLLAALASGNAAGGMNRGGRSAALLVVREGGGYGGGNDRFVDLRVDDHPDPVGELERIYGVWSSTRMVAGRIESIDRFNRNRQYAAAQEETKRLVESLNARLRDHPDDPEVLDGVARALAASGISKERALELSERAVKLAPGKLPYMDTLAECHFRLGHTDEAVRIASEIVAKEPGNEYYRGRLQRFLDARPK